MDSNQNPNVKKTDLDKIIEFYHSVLIVNDAVKLISEGKYYHIVTLFGQLRSLITDNTKAKNKELTPLFEIASILNEKIEIYYMPISSEIRSKEELIFHLSSLPISLKQFIKNQSIISFEDYLDVEVLKYKKSLYSTRRIINALSNKYGGAHYDTSVPTELFEILSLEINNQSPLHNFIIQLADLYVQISFKLLKKITDFDFFVKLFIPKNDIQEPQCLFDYHVPYTSFRMTLFYHNDRLNILLCDFKGIKVNLQIIDVFPINKLTLINITHKMTGQLKSQVSCSFDGFEKSEMILDFPLLMSGHDTMFDVSMNKFYKGDRQDFEFGWSEVVFYKRVLDISEKLGLLSYFNRDEEEIMIFEKNSFATKKSEDEKLIVDGSIRIEKVKINKL